MQKRVAPCSFARRAAAEHFVDLEQRFAAHRRLVVARLRAVRAVLRAAAGLDAEQRAELDLARRVESEMHGARAIHELEQRGVVDRAHLGERPSRGESLRSS